MFQTVSGHIIRDLYDLRFGEVCIEDIAWGLAHQVRFLGQALAERQITIAEHSVLVALEVQNFGITCPRHSLQALLHDAAEAFVGDLPTPVKRLLPSYRVLEQAVQGQILELLGVNAPNLAVASLIRLADRRVLAAERIHCLPAGNEALWDWLPEPASLRIQCLAPQAAHEAFMAQWNRHAAELECNLFVE